MSFLIKWLINIVALFVVVKLIRGVTVDNWQTMALAALIIGLLNTFLKPILVVLTLPINIFTLGIFIFFINALIFYLASLIVPSFHISSFGSGFWAAFLFGLVSYLLTMW